MNLKKEALRDAHEYARAKMYYGEGAGTRRKLINAAVEHKVMTIPGYETAFMDALSVQDMVDHADAARKERWRKDVSKKVDRNVRGIVSGNSQNLTTGVAIVAAAWYIASQTGYDKKIKDRVQKEYRKAKSWVKSKKDKLRKEARA